jgi:hypothetical protein
MLRSQAAGAVDWWSGLFALLAGEQGPWVAAAVAAKLITMSPGLAQRPPPAAIRGAAGGPQRRWLARPAFVLLLAAAAVMIGFAGLASVVVVSAGRPVAGGQRPEDTDVGHTSRRAPRPGAWTDLLSALDSLAQIGFHTGDPGIARGAAWFTASQSRTACGTPGATGPSTPTAAYVSAWPYAGCSMRSGQMNGRPNGPKHQTVGPGRWPWAAPGGITHTTAPTASSRRPAGRPSQPAAPGRS